MSKPKRMLIAVTVLLSLVGLELGLSALKPPEAAVHIFNMGDTPIVDMQIAFGDVTTAVATIPPQQSAVVRLSGWKKDVLKLSYTQLENPLSAFQIADFDPAALHRDKMTLAIEIRSNEFSRAHVTDETPTTLGRLTRNVWTWFVDEPEPSP